VRKLRVRVTVLGKPEIDRANHSRVLLISPPSRISRREALCGGSEPPHLFCMIGDNWICSIADTASLSYRTTLVSVADASMPALPPTPRLNGQSISWTTVFDVAG
jgi:hypothetical protein